MHLRGSISGFNKNSSKSNVFSRYCKGKPSLYVTIIGIGNSIDVGKAEEISGSRRMHAMFMSSTPSDALFIF